MLVCCRLPLLVRTCWFPVAHPRRVSFRLDAADWHATIDMAFMQRGVAGSIGAAAAIALRGRSSRVAVRHPLAALTRSLSSPFSSVGGVQRASMCSMCPRRSSSRAANAGEASAATAVPPNPSPVAPHADDSHSALAAAALSSPTAPFMTPADSHAATPSPASVLASPAAAAPAAAPVLDSVHLQGMRFFSHHGVYAEETRSGQPFEVDLSLTLDLSAAARADDLSLTVDYGAAHAVIARIVNGPPYYHLLEALSLRLIIAMLRAFPSVHAVRVVVRKPRVALPGLLAHSAVSMERRRDQLTDLEQIEREHEQQRRSRANNNTQAKTADT